MSWALAGGMIESLSAEEEFDYVEIRFQKLVDRDPATRRKSAEALASYIHENRMLPDEMDPHPAKVLSDGILAPKADKSAFMGAARALAIMGPAAAPHASGALATLLTHTDPELRWEVARALGKLGPGAAEHAAAATAQALVDDTSNLVKFTCAQALGAMGPNAAQGGSALLAKAIIEDEDPDIQNACAKALKLIGPGAAPASTHALVEAMLEGSFELRRLAVETLCSFGEAAGAGAPAVARVMNAQAPCCLKLHVLRPMKDTQRPCRVCKKKGTEYGCPQGCDHHVCKPCYFKGKAKDIHLQRLAAEALAAMGSEIIQQQQMAFAIALGSKNVPPDPFIEAVAREALELAGCHRALGGSMALFELSPADLAEQKRLAEEEAERKAAEKRAAAEAAAAEAAAAEERARAEEEERRAAEERAAAEAEAAEERARAEEEERKARLKDTRKDSQPDEEVRRISSEAESLREPETPSQLDEELETQSQFDEETASTSSNRESPQEAVAPQSTTEFFCMDADEDGEPYEVVFQAVWVRAEPSVTAAKLEMKSRGQVINMYESDVTGAWRRVQVFKIEKGVERQVNGWMKINDEDLGPLLKPFEQPAEHPEDGEADGWW
mmetsp:Transcript_71122/g.135648  ORF Transcript_71122/g.135648 Transcript_71122/m.135648 type:complete len:613 (-) Transcript_71122:74-1912(-)